MSMQITQEMLDKLDTINLKLGAHAESEGQMCAMEAAAFIAGEQWSWRPLCVDPVITDIMYKTNDHLPDDASRNAILKPLIPLILGTRSYGDARSRAKLVRVWLEETFLPTLLDKIPGGRELLAREGKDCLPPTKYRDLYEALGKHDSIIGHGPKRSALYAFQRAASDVGGMAVTAYLNYATELAISKAALTEEDISCMTKSFQNLVLAMVDQGKKKEEAAQ